MTVRGNDPDGHSAVAIVQVRERERWVPYDTYWNSRGSNAATPSRYYSIRDGTLVRYRACLGESRPGKIFSCGRWKVDNA